MDFLGAMFAKAKSLQKRLVLTEGTEPQTIRAARIILDERLALHVTLLGKESEIQKNAAHDGVDLSHIDIINPGFSSQVDKYADEYYELRKLRGMTKEQARANIISPLRWGAMMVHLGEADAVVGGAEDNAIDVLYAGLAIIGTAPGLRTASSCIVIQSHESSWGVDGAFIFSDCSVVPNPLADQLSDIALAAAQSCRDFLGAEPVVALLSHSTRGQKGDHKDLEKVRNAYDMVKNREPTLVVDGELQVDAALVPHITDIKASGSPVRGRVNTMVFPDMDAGNIGYKLVRNFGNAQTFGPYLQGFAKPISYIPRGATVNTIVISCAATLARAK
jgi:phosphate acetyltransferase